MPADREPTPLERFSAPLLVLLSRIPRWLLIVIVLALTFGGLLIDSALGGVLLLVMALFLVWLAIIGWPRLSATGRVLRLLTVGLVVYVAFTKIL